MPPDEVAEAECLHDLAEKVDGLFVSEGIVEGHVMPHFDIRYDSTAARSVSERAAL